jgi:hypothetical protein
VDAAPAPGLDLRGQLSGWHLDATDDEERAYSTGIRYIPELGIMHPANGSDFLEIVLSLNAYASFGTPETYDEAEIELYRLTLRFVTDQTETRLGLQTVEFGPAYLLRSLRWFDRVDPRDPLGLTDGIYALRFKYSALNNAALLLWGMYGNDEPKGYERLPSSDERPEFGGRLEYPLLSGELGVTVHSRVVDASQLPFIEDFTENRFALDGRWDIEIGFWFEAVLQHQQEDLLPYQWTKLVTAGADYTFGIGNGLHTLVEHMAVISSAEAAGREEDTQSTAYSLNYPIGFRDNLQAIGYYSWDEQRYHQYLAWQRSWDRLILHIAAYYNTDPAREDPLYESSVLSTGYGGQVMLIFNH